MCPSESSFINAAFVLICVLSAFVVRKAWSIWNGHVMWKWIAYLLLVGTCFLHCQMLWAGSLFNSCITKVAHFLITRWLTKYIFQSYSFFYNQRRTCSVSELRYPELLASRNSLQIHLSCCYCAALALLGRGLEADDCFQSALMYLLPLSFSLADCLWLKAEKDFVSSQVLACFRGKRQPSPQSERTQTSANTPTNFLALMQNYSIKSHTIHTARSVFSCEGASTTLFHPRCLHREMVREMALMESTTIKTNTSFTAVDGLIDGAVSDDEGLACFRQEKMC